jgi:hypothetical protein
VEKLKVCPIDRTTLKEYITEFENGEPHIILECVEHGIMGCYMEVPAANELPQQPKT